MSLFDVKLSDHPYFTIDVETTGLKWWKDKVFGVALALPDGQTFYEDIRSNPQVKVWLQDQAKALKATSCSTKIVNHHLKFDLHFLREMGVDFPLERLACTMTRSALVNEHEHEYGLDHLARKYSAVGKDSTIYAELYKLFGGRETKKAQMPNLQHAPIEIVAPYGKADALAALRLYESQEPLLDQQELRNVEALEHRLLPVLLRMEHGGVRVDIEGAERAVKHYDKILAEAQQTLNKAAGREINTNSPKQIADIFKPKYRDGFWVTDTGETLETTDAGAPSFGRESIENLRDPRFKQIMTIRNGIKMRDTFLKGHILGHHHNGYVHTTFNQTKTDNENGVGPGRLSSTDPALQQIHKRNKEAAEILRSLFLPDQGQEWHCFDYSQIDFRVFSHYAKVPEVIAAYAKDPTLDYHAIVARLTGLPRTLSEAHKLGRKGAAKTINLAMVFGAGPGKIAKQMGLPYTTEVTYEEDENGNRVLNKFGNPVVKKSWLRPGKEAEEVFEAYHSNVPGVRAVLDQAKAIAKSRGYVLSLAGRRIRFPKGMYAHKAGGLVFQAGAADLNKIKLIEADELLRGTGARLALSVHDEFDITSGENPGLIQKMQSTLEDFEPGRYSFELRVPIKTSHGSGPNWYEASKD